MMKFRCCLVALRDISIVGCIASLDYFFTNYTLLWNFPTRPVYYFPTVCRKLNEGNNLDRDGLRHACVVTTDPATQTLQLASVGRVAGDTLPDDVEDWYGYVPKECVMLLRYKEFENGLLLGGGGADKNGKEVFTSHINAIVVLNGP
eukprot:PhF_6_TR3180/c0_g1_i2/m.4572